MHVVVGGIAFSISRGVCKKKNVTPFKKEQTNKKKKSYIKICLNLEIFLRTNGFKNNS